MKRLPCTLLIALAVAAPLCLACAAAAQSQPAQQPVPKASGILQPALTQVSQAVSSLNISRWKAPNEVKTGTQQNVDSILRDLNNTLPGLLSAADSAPESVAAIFPVYRNIDALYDVLLRVSQTADLAAPQNESANIDNALSQLESARSELGNAILITSKNNEAESLRLKTAIQQEAAAKAATPPKTTIVNDGPATSSSTTKRRKKLAAPSAGSSSAPQQ